jgi:MFS family permease
VAPGRLLRRVAVDVTPLRESRDLRLLELGSFVTGLGTQASLVALPYQLYVQTRSPFLTGLLGAVELVPLIASALVGGALADRMDRKRLLLLTQIALVLTTAALSVLALSGAAPLMALYVLGALLAAAGALQNVARAAILPNLVAPARMPSALALHFGLANITQVIGPAFAGLLIAAAGVEVAYAVDAASCLALVGAVLPMAAQPPRRLDADGEQLGIGRSIAEGLRWVRSKPALVGSFAIDLSAMTFGMPRALFPVLALTVYHAGAAGTGLLYAAVAAGATVAALTTGWLAHARRLGRIVIVAVAAWGAAIALAGVTSSLWIAAALLALAGAADSVSAVCRSTITQSVTPDAMRGRMGSVFSLVVTSGPRLGDVESGAVAGLTSARTSVVTGGLACVLSVGAIVAAFPALARYDAREALAAQEAEAAALRAAA